MDVKEALDMLEEYQTYWSEIYREAKEDLEFFLGDQWLEDDKKIRGKRPCLVVNTLPQFTHQVTNQIRQNTPSINVMPSDSVASAPTAKKLKGLIRNIEYRSGADEVYDTAAEYQVESSLGFIRVDHDYIDPGSMDQELLIKRVQNPSANWIDPSSIECDGSDAMGAICLDTISKAEFEKLYPDKGFVSFEGNPKHDEKRETITIAEIFKKELVNTEKVGNRQLQKVVIRRYKFSGDDLLQETTFPGEYIPLVPVYGQEKWVDGKRHLLSLIRNAKDPQRRYNHWASVEAELLSKAPIAPVMAEAGSIEDFAEDWQNPQKAMVLRYKNTNTDGTPANAPTRLMPPAASNGYVNAMQGAYEDIKRSMGLYDASVGQKSNETSGVAIEARKDQGDVATFHFPDNLRRSIEHVGRILVCAIPVIYDTPRVIQIIGEEENAEMVAINGERPLPGQVEEYDLTQGKYDVRVTTGPSFTSMRQEASAKLGEIVQSQPQLMGVFGDLFIKNLDIPNAEAIAARIRKTIPPNLTAEEDAKKDGQIPPTPKEMMLEQQLQQAQQQMQQMAQEFEQSGALSKQMDAQNKAGELSIKQDEASAKRREIDVKLYELQIKAQAEASKALIEQQKLSLERTKLLMDQANRQQALTGETVEPEMVEPSVDPIEAEREAMEIQREEQEFAIRQEQAAAVINTLNAIAQQITVLAERANQPMMAVRDPQTGMITGSVPGVPQGVTMQ